MFGGMAIKSILGFFTGGGAAGLGEQIRLARQDQLNAANDSDKLAADERMAGLALQASAQSNGTWDWLPKLVRGLWVAPFILYTWKLVFWDKILGRGTTDGLNPDLSRLMLMMAAFYFLDASIKHIRGR